MSDSWLQTYTGRAVTLDDIKEDDICIEDIAHSLALTCRYRGHCREFYSVAQHSIIVSGILQWSITLMKCGLLHDAAEAYIQDLATPIKELCPEYRQLEDAFMKVIIEKFDLPDACNVWGAVKQADLVVLATEKRDLMASAPRPWRDLPEPLNMKIVPLQWQEAERMFLKKFEELFKKE